MRLAGRPYRRIAEQARRQHTTHRGQGSDGPFCDVAYERVRVVDSPVLEKHQAAERFFWRPLIRWWQSVNRCLGFWDCLCVVEAGYD